jgi:hypothetical protein
LAAADKLAVTPGLLDCKHLKALLKHPRGALLEAAAHLVLEHVLLEVLANILQAKQGAGVQAPSYTLDTAWWQRFDSL